MRRGFPQCAGPPLLVGRGPPVREGLPQVLADQRKAAGQLLSRPLVEERDPPITIEKQDPVARVFQEGLKIAGEPVASKIAGHLVEPDRAAEKFIEPGPARKTHYRSRNYFLTGEGGEGDV